MATRSDVSKALALTCEFFGKQLSEGAVDMLMDDLSDIDPESLLNAIRSCRRELSRFPTLADIISRVEAKDGRPGVEEAWARIPKDSIASCVWTIEMATAYGVAHSHLINGDHIAARMAFKEVYEKEVKASRSVGMPVTWSASLGEDKPGRDAAISEAVRLNQLTGTQANILIGLTQGSETLRLADDSEVTNSVSPEEAQARIREMIASISKPLPSEEA